MHAKTIFLCQQTSLAIDVRLLRFSHMPMALSLSKKKKFNSPTVKQIMNFFEVFFFIPFALHTEFTFNYIFLLFFFALVSLNFYQHHEINFSQICHFTIFFFQLYIYLDFLSFNISAFFTFYFPRKWNQLFMYMFENPLKISNYKFYTISSIELYYQKKNVQFTEKKPKEYKK